MDFAFKKANIQIMKGLLLLERPSRPFSSGQDARFTSERPLFAKDRVLRKTASINFRTPSDPEVEKAADVNDGGHGGDGHFEVERLETALTAVNMATRP